MKGKGKGGIRNLEEKVKWSSSFRFQDVRMRRSTYECTFDNVHEWHKFLKERAETLT